MAGHAVLQQQAIASHLAAGIAHIANASRYVVIVTIGEVSLLRSCSCATRMRSSRMLTGFDWQPKVEAELLNRQHFGFSTGWRRCALD